MNVSRFNGCFSRRLAPLLIVFGCSFWILGYSVSPSLAAVDRITGAEAVQRLQQVLGDPAKFENDMKNSTQDFISDHFGTMAIAAAFGIAIRMRS
ncbi:MULTISPECIES: hypothetical protein [unclassified Microcoleus]|uniref:hypothetical protein n=1 Tax=unclassified Microcoleus TaxID=2642155 RepID=UPI002FD40A78